MLFWIAVAATVGAAVGWFGGMNPGPWPVVADSYANHLLPVLEEIAYEKGWKAGYEAAEEKEDEAICGFETTYDWQNNRKT